MKRLISIIILIVVLVIIAIVAIPKSQTGTAIEVGNKQSLAWNTADVSSPKVMVNIIKQVGTNPNTYELVRTVSQNASNDGSAVWVPAVSDINENLLVEVGCTPSPDECRAHVIASGLAVIDSSKYASVAAVYQAIESAENN